MHRVVTECSACWPNAESADWRWRRTGVQYYYYYCFIGEVGTVDVSHVVGIGTGNMRWPDLSIEVQVRDCGKYSRLMGWTSMTDEYAWLVREMHTCSHVADLRSNDRSKHMSEDDFILKNRPKQHFEQTTTTTLIMVSACFCFSLY